MTQESKIGRYFKWTKQDIFNAVVRHLRRQGQKSGEEGGCFYRFNGLKCAAGIFIPDNVYDERMEGSRVCNLPFFRDNFSELQLGFLDSLQHIHDFEPPEHWMFHLARLAGVHNLQISAIFEPIPDYGITLPEPSRTDES